ncbi:uncharacterized protein B0H64DRAFT_439043 [Chaetomium fimeti]|uniref:Uncharacterized protein n=1 Tax=Chaetomium fimeti TaxID=1854472 RepID=A0AAE0LV86_9PEZI|nr:hypothetical protein B0H64DRAFT_439043 [Chaetomium fimeti]
MDPQDNTKSWTTLFVENAQSERQKREQHTADIQQSIQHYTIAAEDKIKAALGPEAAALLPGSTAAPPANPPRCIFRARTLFTRFSPNGNMLANGDPEVSISPTEAADTPRLAHALDNKADAGPGGMNQAADSASSTIVDLDLFGRGEELRSSLFADCFEVDGSYTTGGSLFSGDQGTTDTYAWALASDEAQACVRW